jgi:hypothetical protein
MICSSSMAPSSDGRVSGGCSVKRIDVVKKDNEWVAKAGPKVVARAPVKARSAGPTTVKIHKEDGRIQEERTYPRSADPKRSKG